MQIYSAQNDCRYLFTLFYQSNKLRAGVELALFCLNSSMSGNLTFALSRVRLLQCSDIDFFHLQHSLHHPLRFLSILVSQQFA